MKKLIALFALILVPAMSHASEITCFSNGITIYHGYGEKISYTSEFIYFTETKTKAQIIMFADCLLRLTDDSRVKRQHG